MFSPERQVLTKEDDKEAVKPSLEPVAERPLDIDEKIDFLNNGIPDNTKEIAKQARQQEVNERIDVLRKGLGLSVKEKEPKLYDVLTIEPKSNPETLENLSNKEFPEEEKILENELDLLEQQLRALPQAEREALVNSDGGDAGVLESDYNDEGGRRRKGGGWSEGWLLKEVKKNKIPFLRLMAELVDGKGISLKKLAFISDYLESWKKEIRAELLYHIDDPEEEVEDTNE